MYSIGYGNRPVKELIKLLKEQEIAFVVDVRSFPSSKYNPNYNKDALASELNNHGIKYVFMGDVLGGRPEDPTVYVDGKVDYSKCRGTAWFKKGIARLKTAWGKNLRVCVMCSESKPEQCHRSKLIGQELAKLDIEMLHIDEKANLKSQKEVISMLTKEAGLFQDEPKFTSRKTYRTPDPTDVM